MIPQRMTADSSKYSLCILLPIVLFIGTWMVCLIPLLSAPVPEVPYASLNTVADGSTGPFENMDITFETKDLSSHCKIYYKPPYETEPRVLDETSPHPAGIHRFAIHNLTEDTAYHYRINCGGGDYDQNKRYPHAFHTLSRKKFPRDLLLLSDPQINPVALSHMKAVMESVAKSAAFEPGPVIISGDLVQQWYSPKMWNLFFSYAKEILGDRPAFTAPGNHDCNRGNYGKCPYSEKYFGNPTGGYYHAWEYGDSVLLIGLGDYEELPQQAWNKQIAWLEKTLEKHKRYPVKILVNHRPFIANPDPRNEPEMKTLLAVCEKYGVNIHICGHQHTYRRLDVVSPSGKHILELVIGGAGGALEPVLYWSDFADFNYTARMTAQNPAPCFGTMRLHENNSVGFKVWSIYGQVMDTFSVRVGHDGSLNYNSADQTEKPPTNAKMVAVTPYVVTSLVAVTFVLFCLVSAFLSCFSSSSSAQSKYQPVPHNSVTIIPMKPLEAEQKESLVCNLALGVVSVYYALLLGVGAGSGYTILVGGAYGRQNNLQFEWTILINTLGTIYAWVALNAVDTNWLRIVLDTAVFAALMLCQAVWGTIFQLFGLGYTNKTMLLGVVGAAVVLELLGWVIVPKSRIRTTQKSTLKDILWAEPVVICVATCLVAECMLTWCGLSLGTLLAFLSL